MTDNGQWQPPAWTPPSSPAPAQPTFGGYNPGGSGQAAPGSAAPGGWAPPPRPGLIPLQPMTLGTILSAAFRVMRRNPRPTIGIALLIQGLISVLTVGVSGFFLISVISSTGGLNSTSTSTTVPPELIGAFAVAGLLGLVAAAISIVGVSILQGLISLEVARATIGEKLTLAGLWSRARGRIGALIGWSVLVGGAALIAVGIVLGLVVLLMATAGVAGAVVGVLLWLIAIAGFVVVGVWLFTRWSLVPSVLMMERRSIFDAARRSWSLTTGYFWRTFGIILLVSAIVSVATQIVTTPIQLIGGIAGGLMNPGGDAASAVPTIIGMYVVLALVTAAVSAIGAVLTISTVGLLYIDLRMRKEGLDIELSRYVEERQTSTTTLADPFLVPGAATAGAARSS